MPILRLFRTKPNFLARKFRNPFALFFTKAHLDVLAKDSLLVLKGLDGPLVLVEEGPELHPVLLTTREHAAHAYPAQHQCCGSGYGIQCLFEL